MWLNVSNNTGQKYIFLPNLGTLPHFIEWAETSTSGNPYMAEIWLLSTARRSLGRGLKKEKRGEEAKEREERNEHRTTTGTTTNN